MIGKKFRNADPITVAEKIATRAHKGVTRKGSNKPYVTHVIEVKEILEKAGVQDSVVLSAALLHDVLEDSEIDSTSLFLELVSKGVMESKAVGIITLVEQLTSPDKHLSVKPLFNRFVRKVMTRYHFKYVSPEATMIKIADRLHNIRDVQTIEDTDFHKVYAKETIQLTGTFRSKLDSIREDLRPEFKNLISEIESISDGILNESKSSV